jgi:hypothetical protein
MHCTQRGLTLNPPEQQQSASAQQQQVQPHVRETDLTFELR